MRWRDQGKMPPSIFISAGEASGEHYGALLIAALKRQLAAAGQTAEFFGMGGARMEAAGLERIVRAEDMAVMGLTEVVHHLPRIYGEYRKLKQAIRTRRPAAAVLIDFPGLHFKLAAEFHRLGIPVLYFVSPQLWAWKKGRISKVRKYIDRMLVIFPFEEQFYRDHGVEAEFVGHPLAEQAAPAINRKQFAAENGLDPEKTWIGLLPGSRAKEIREILPEMLLAGRQLAAHSAEEPKEGLNALKGHGFSRAAEVPNMGAALAAEVMPVRENALPQEQKSNPTIARSVAQLKPRPFKEAGSSDFADSTAAGFQFLIPLAPTLNAAQRIEVERLARKGGDELEIRLVDDARAALHHARVSVVASGTATVEAALVGNPFIVVYRVSPVTFAIAKRLVKVPNVAMANLIAGKRIVPELIQSDFTAKNIVQQLAPLLPDGPLRQSMMQELARVRGLLQAGRAGNPAQSSSAIERVAEVVLDLLR
jgi:lipid-A-disaccharide synthase